MKLDWEIKDAIRELRTHVELVHKKDRYFVKFPSGWLVCVGDNHSKGYTPHVIAGIVQALKAADRLCVNAKRNTLVGSIG